MKVLLFARIRDQVGIESLNIEEPLTVAELRLLMQQRFPAHSALFDEHFSLVAVNQEIETAAGRPLQESDEVAFLPPMTGG